MSAAGENGLLLTQSAGAAATSRSPAVDNRIGRTGGRIPITFCDTGPIPRLTGSGQ